MSNEKINSFIKMVIEEDLVQAQSTLKEYLNDKLTDILQEKYEEYAPTVFEEKMATKDWDGDGEVETSSEEHAGVVDNAIKAKKGKGQSEEEEEGESEDEDSEEDGEETEESEEDGEEDEE